MLQHRRHIASALLSALALSACGTTVATTSQGTAYDNQLGAGPAATTSTSTGELPTTGGNGLTSGSAGATTGVGAPSSSTGSGVQPGTVEQPTTTGGTTGSGTGTTTSSVKSPIKIGIVLTATSNAASFGVSYGNMYTEQSIDQALVDGLNAQGGLSGRKIVPVFAKTDTGSANWETDFSAACATFTQDNHVEAVLGYVFNYFSSFEKCLASHGIPHLNTGFNIPDATELRPFPLQVALDVPNIDRRGLLKLEHAVADGVLTHKSKLGVLSDTCPGTQRSLNGVFLPKAKSLGITVAKNIAINCPNGNSDSGGAVSALQNAVLQFASAGVDQVVFHSTSEGPALLLFGLSAESQNYRPGYLVTSLANLDSIKGYFPAKQAGNINGYGWLPTQDLSASAYPKRNALQTRCLGLLRKKSITPTVSADYYYAYNMCEAFFVYELALSKTAGNSSGGPVVQAVHGLGTQFASLTNDGGSLFSPTLPDAPRAARHTVFNSSCTCFSYVGPARPIPSS